MSLTDSLEASVSSTWNDITSTGVPAVIAGAESYAASQLTTQATANTAAATAAAQQIVASSGTSTGIMASIQGIFGNIAQNTIVKQYGIYILVGAVVLFVVIRKA